MLYHDETGEGLCRLGYQGVENGQASTDGPAFGRAASGWYTMDLLYTTNTSGWYSFNLLAPGTYHVTASPPAGSWWTPTTSETCDATLASSWDRQLCYFGYWWGLDAPTVTPGAVALRQAHEWAAQNAAQQELVLTPVQDTYISEWFPGNHGAEAYLQVRQPGVVSTLVQFDLSGLPLGVEVVSAKLMLYSPMRSNTTNRLYMTAYPLDKPWVEGEATWLMASAATPWSVAGATADHGAPVGWGWIDGVPGWVEIDLDVATLMGWLENNGFLIRGEGTWNREVAYWYFSREYGNAGVHPRLVLGLQPLAP
jgi:hypothetical protein